MNDHFQNVKLELPSVSLMTLLGTQDKHVARMENQFSVKIVARGNDVSISGRKQDVQIVGKILTQLSQLIESGKTLSARDVTHSIKLLSANPELSLIEFYSGNNIEPGVARFVQARSLKQKIYLESIQHHDMVISIGPAGTGKTYLAVGMACAYLTDKKVRRIILTRPAVEAGERLGFLPGDITAKIDPYLRPLYDALYDMLGYDKVTHLLKKDVIEIAPLAFMRGRTLNEAFIILDEAQNTTTEQMKMFLTRMGFSSKVVITGDVTQTDLPQGRKSGLKEARWILENVEGIRILEMDERDVIRHPLVQEVIAAYERSEESHEK